MNPATNSHDGASGHGQAAPDEATVTTVEVVIPAYNEEESLPLVLGDLPRTFELDGRPVVVRRVVVADNNSRDNTAEVGRAAGAVVVPAPRQGYGSACLTALDEVRRPTIAAPVEFVDPATNQPLTELPTSPPDIVLFIDADYSDHPDELPNVVAPIVRGEADFVIGSRILGKREPGAMLPQARFGNWLATALIRLFWGHRYTDLGPFRAARWEAFEALDMCDPDFGWTVELQVKAIERGFRVIEVPVSYRKRVGVSKITGTISGTFRAGYKILYIIARHRLRGWLSGNKANR